MKKENNYAFIDGQNVNLATQDQGWKLDWKRFRIYLADKYKVSKAYLFIGYIINNNDLYTFLQESGFILIFKPVMEISGMKTKGNVDAELVLQVMIDFNDYDKAVVVTGDGDFGCLIKYLSEKNKLKKLIVPNQKRFSVFLKTEGKGNIDSLTNLRSKLEYKRKYKKKEIHKLSTST